MTSAVLKYIAVIAMLIDHVGAFILEDMYGINSTIYILSRSIGRIAFPIFAFLLVEGFKKTKNRKKYFINLLIFALLSEIPFDLANKGSLMDFNQQNIFFTLLTNLTMLCVIEGMKIDKTDLKAITEILIVLLFSLVSMLFKFDYSFFAPLVVYSYYKFYGNIKMRFLASELSLYFEAFSLVHVSNILIYYYNGKRGRQNKYFFYFFYPLHLLIIYFFTKI